MKIGIFSKFEMAGGSERRCMEIARGINQYSNHEAIILCERNLPSSLRQDREFECIENSFDNLEHFNSCDIIIVINTDSKDFTTANYWLGKSSRHDKSIGDGLNGKRIWFLFNFLVSPSRHLDELESMGAKVGIFTANKKFFDEITKQDRYEDVRALPRYQLNSPIDPESVIQRIRGVGGDTLNIGFHSKGLGNKWNDEIPDLVKKVYDRYGESIRFSFMGIKSELRSCLSSCANVTCLSENEISVKDFLNRLDLFMFFPSFKREEPWCRVIAEAMVSGLPVLATDKGGNPDQVLNGNNGFLCKRTDDFYKRIVEMKENPSIINIMSQNSIQISRDFTTEAVIKKMLGIIV